jgi:radical SAM superfamily enzyme YgiQ (UPF0313 family)
MQKDNNIVLISFYNLDSLSVRLLQAVLKRAGFSVHSIFFKQQTPACVLEAPTEEEIRALVDLVKKLKPRFVGLSVYSTVFKLASRITKEIKKELDVLVIWGGIHPTIKPDQCLGFCDIVCVGEGEEPIKELAAGLFLGKNIEDIKNLWIKKNDRIIKNDLRPLISDLDSLPFADFSDENKYFVGGVPLQRKVYPIITSRGCFFQCAYCCNNILKKIYHSKGNYVRRRSAENVISELIQAKKIFKNLKSITFHDDIFTFDKEWIKRFCQQYKTAIGLPFRYHCHPKVIDEEIIRLLKDAGCTAVIMGIQSGSEFFRHKYYERYDTNEEILKAAKMFWKYKIGAHYDVIMDNPLETEKNKRETLDLLLNLPKPFGLCTYSLTHFPETKLTNLLLAKEMISENDIEDQKQEELFDKHWRFRLDSRRRKDDLFWDNLYYLVQNKRVPRQVVIWLSHRKFLKRRPAILTFLLKSVAVDLFTVNTDSKIDILRRKLLLKIKQAALPFWKIQLYLRKK